MWPFSRLRSYVASSTPSVKADDLDDIQDSIIDLNKNRGYFREFFQTALAGGPYSTDQSPIPEMPSWNFTGSGTRSFAVSNPAGGYPGRTGGINLGSAGATGQFCTAFPVAFSEPGTIFRLDGYVQFNNSATSYTTRFGIATAAGPANFAVALSVTNASANIFVSGDGSYHDTGVAWSTVTSIHKFRFLWDTATGAMEWYIDDMSTPVATFTAATGPGAAMFLQMYLTGTGGSNLAAMTLSDVDFGWY